MYGDSTGTNVGGLIYGASNTKAVLDYKSGKNESFNFLVGQVMKKTQGRGDPETIRRLMKKLI